MGIELPTELAGVADQAGVQWPQADEEAMRSTAQAWRDAGTRLSSLGTTADGTAHQALSAVQGTTGDAARSHWNTFTAPDTGHLTTTVAGCHAAADRLEHAADQIGAAKVQIVSHLTTLAKTSDAAHAAAQAGHPTALLGLDTAVNGTAANVANVHQNLTQAVRLDTGVNMQHVQAPVSTTPSAAPAGLGGLSGAVSGLGQHAASLASAAGVPVTGGLGQHGAELASAPGVGAPAGQGDQLLGGSTLGGLTGSADHVVNSVAGPGGLTDHVASGVTGPGGVVDHVAGPGGLTDQVGQHGTQLASGVGGPDGLVGGAGHQVADLGGAAGQSVTSLAGPGGPAGQVVGGVAGPDGVAGVAGHAAAGLTGPGGAAGPGGLAGPGGAAGPGGGPGQLMGGPGAAVGQPVSGVTGPVDQVVSGAAGQPGYPGDFGGAGEHTGPVSAGTISGADHLPHSGAPTPAMGTTVQSSAAVASAPSSASIAPSDFAPTPATGIPAQATAAPSPVLDSSLQGQMGGWGATAGPTAAPAGGSLVGTTGSPVNSPMGGQGPTAGPVVGPVGRSAPEPSASPRSAARGDEMYAAPVTGQAGQGDVRRTGLARPMPAAPAQSQPSQSSDVALFLVYVFPVGHLPVASSRPIRQLPPPPVETDYAAGLRFPPHDHPEAGLMDDSEVVGCVSSEGATEVGELTERYDPLGGDNERDWDRRFLVRPAAGEQPAEYAWPPSELCPEGGVEPGEPVVLAEDTIIDRFGPPEGRVFAADGTPFRRRSLPPDALTSGYRRYRVLRELPVWEALVAGWFGQPGGGTRYRALYPAADLVALGYLEEIA